VGPVQGRIDIDNVVRPAAVAGLALVGDAVLNGGLDDALKRYRARHHAELGPHQALIAEGSKARPPSNTERMLLSAAAKDERLAERFHLYASRTRAA